MRLSLPAKGHDAAPPPSGRGLGGGRDSTTSNEGHTQCVFKSKGPGGNTSRMVRVNWLMVSLVGS
jgi:hypothetical protein